jgi:hypothetical protein
MGRYGICMQKNPILGLLLSQENEETSLNSWVTIGFQRRRSEFLTTVKMSMVVFWGVTPY